MAEHNQTGKTGEELAAIYLEEKGFEILEKNWRNRFKEIDIIAKKDDLLVIVEVKTRSTMAFGTPADFVGLKKQRNLINAAEAYIFAKNSDLETRFDIVSILLQGDRNVIEHIEWAFSPFD